MTSPWDPPAQPNQPNDPNQPQQPNVHTAGQVPPGQYSANPQHIPGQPIPGQHAPGQPYPGQAGIPGQPVMPGQPIMPGGPQTPKSGGNLKNILVSLLVIAVVGVGGFFAYKSIFKPGNQGSEGDVSSTKTISVFDVRPGNCIGAFPTDADQLYEVEVIPCAEAHKAEVYAEHEIAESAFTSEDDYLTMGIEYCGPIFQEKTAHLSEADFEQIGWWPMYPSKESWNAGDRLITCVVETEVQMTGSLTNSDVQLQ